MKAAAVALIAAVLLVAVDSGCEVVVVISATEMSALGETVTCFAERCTTLSEREVAQPDKTASNAPPVKPISCRGKTNTNNVLLT